MKMKNLLGYGVKNTGSAERISFFRENKKLHIVMSDSDIAFFHASVEDSGPAFQAMSVSKTDFTKAYRQDCKIDGTPDGNSLVMQEGRWLMEMSASLENDLAITADLVDTTRVKVDVGPLRSVATEDNYGASAWAIFHEDGLAIIATPYYVSAVPYAVGDNPSTVVIPASCIGCVTELDEPVIVSNVTAVEITGKMALAKTINASVRMVVSKPVSDPPDPDFIISIIPVSRKGSMLSVNALSLKQVIDSTVKSFKDEAKALTISVTKHGLQVNVKNDSAKMTETVEYIKKPVDLGDFTINSISAMLAFKGLNITSSDSKAYLKWDEKQLSMYVTDSDGVHTGSVVLALSPNAKGGRDE